MNGDDCYLRLAGDQIVIIAFGGLTDAANADRSSIHPRGPAGDRNGSPHGPRGAAAGAAVRTRNTASGCEGESEGNALKKSPKPLQIKDLGDNLRCDATNRESSGEGIRTPDTRIMIPLL
jgi:hypothetical protein